MGELKIEIEKSELLDKELSDMVCHLIEKGVEIFENGRLIPIIFIFNSKSKRVGAAFMDFKNQREKEGMVNKVKELVKELKADATLFICESWALQLEGKEGEEFAKNREKYGQVKDHPKAFDCIMFSLESRQGTWMANTRVLEDERTTEEDIKLKKLDGSEGLMSNFIHLKSVTN